MGNLAGVTVRRAVPADAEPLAEFAERSFRATFEANNAPADMDDYCSKAFAVATVRSELEDRSLSTWVARAGSDIVAYAQLSRGEVPDCVRDSTAVELRRLYVDARWHGSGLADVLLHEVREAVRALRAATVWLGVWERNDRALRYYRKAGFSVAGDHTFLLGSDPQRDLILVLRASGAGGDTEEP